MLSKRLKEARKKKKITQEELAKKIRTTKATISNYENGYSSPSNELLKELADSLEVTTDWLLGREPVNYSKNELDFIKDVESLETLKKLKEEYDFDIADLSDDEILMIVAYIRAARAMKKE